jgi:hypothetical protein
VLLFQLTLLAVERKSPLPTHQHFWL